MKRTGMKEYVDVLHKNWTLTTSVSWDPIETPKETIIKKTVDNSFDNGRTMRWIDSLATPTWFSIQGAGNRIHVISDRSVAELTPTLEKALRIMSWLSKKSLTFFWWDQPWPRNLTPYSDPGPEHLNGGWAIPGVPEIHVYRREEALKVMIHEAIHALLLDVKPDLVEPVRLQFETHFGRKLWPHLGECYTELFAELLWSIIQGHPWSRQLVCSEKQAGQVWARIHDSKEAERTNVFAYYILKWVLMQHKEVFFGPNHCVSMWFEWFLHALPKLESLRHRYRDSERESLSLAMTCPTFTELQ